MFHELRMVPIDSALKHASTNILLCQIISGFAKEMQEFLEISKTGVFFSPSFLHNRLHGGPPSAFAVPASSQKSIHGKLTPTACLGPLRMLPRTLIPWSGLRAPQPWNGAKLPCKGASTTLTPPASATFSFSSVGMCVFSV